MTVYEWCRVLLGILQLVATLGVPFVMLWLDNRAVRRHLDNMMHKKKKPTVVKNRRRKMKQKRGAK